MYPTYPKLQFTVNRPKQIVNLVLVHKEKNENDKLQKDCLLYHLHGNVDLIQQKKTPLTKDKVGILYNGVVAHRVLIEGPPGIGKTTFLWQLCHQWSLGELLQQWQLVILVQLREETARTALHLFDLLYHPRNSIRMAVCQEIEEQEGEGVLIMFDGYDELSDEQRTGSIFMKILKQQLLRKATVIVCSRPFASNTLSHQFKNNLDQHVEIVGFDTKDIEAYISSACQDNSDLLKDLRAYIFTQPFISSLLYNPLHCTIVTEMYIQCWQRGEKGFAPNTLTQIYDILLVNLLRRHLRDESIDSLSELPTVINLQLKELAELAAKGIKERKYIFSSVPSETLGLMNSVRQLHDIRTKRSTCHSFVHLTLQEYLAALHWSQFTPEQLTELLQQEDLFPIQQYLLDVHRKTKTEKQLLSTQQRTHCDKDCEEEEVLRVTHWPVLLFLAGSTQLTSILIRWISQGGLFSKTIVLWSSGMCQLLFESQSPNLVSAIFSGKKVSLSDNVSSPLDWFVTGYCIAHSDSTSLWDVWFTNHPHQCLQAFSFGLHYSSCTPHMHQRTGTIHDLILRNTKNATEFAQYLDVFDHLDTYIQEVTKLHFAGTMQPGKNGVPVLHELSRYCPKLKSLRLPELLSPLLTQVPQFPYNTLETLLLSLPLLKDDNDLVPLLKQCSVLKCLCFNTVNK